LAEVTRWTATRDYSSGASSSPVYLQAGQLLHLQATHRQKGGKTHVSVGVRIPGEAGGRAMPDSIPEIQVLEVSVIERGERQSIRVFVDPPVGCVQRFTVPTTAESAPMAFVLQLSGTFCYIPEKMG
jgi:hypothetical protein